jgi:hypothetical protein
VLRRPIHPHRADSLDIAPADPSFKALFGIDRITLTLSGREDGDMTEFEGAALQAPGVAFRALLSRISD